MTEVAPGHRLPDSLVDLLRHLVASLTPVGVGEAIIAQALSATIVKGSPTMVDLQPTPGAPRIDLPNGPIPVRAFVQGEGVDPDGEVLVWIREGQLIGLEQAWYTDEPPWSWPAPEAVNVA